MSRSLACSLITLFALSLSCGTAEAQSVAATARSGTAGAGSVSSDYTIGPEDVIGVLFWREQDISGDVTVRPDGMITVPLIGEVKAAGLRPDELRDVIQQAASKYLTDAKVSIPVREINSRKVFITGEVTTPGPYPLTGPRTVMQLIALAGGVTEYADTENISILRNGEGRALKFNYDDVAKGKKLEQNIQLQPGDTVVVP